MFSIPFGKSHVKAWAENKDRVLSNLEKVADFTGSEMMPCKSTYMSGMKKRHRNLHHFEEFFGVIESTLYGDIYPELGQHLGGHQVVECWYQRYGKHDFHELHNHGALGWSAVFYAELDPNEHVGTTFYSPFQDAAGDLISCTPPVEEGDLIMFPSFLLHEATPCRSDKTRAIISFNLRRVDCLPLQLGDPTAEDADE